MLSSKVIHALGNALNFGSKFGFQALQCNFETNTFYVRRGILFNILLLANIIQQILYSGYMISRLVIELSGKGSNNYSQIFWLLLYADGGCWFTGTAVWAWFHRYEMASFLNEIVSSGHSFRKGMKDAH